jgi:arsenate reductase
MIVVTGLKKCDTCRNAMKWLKAEGIDARLHDLRADGLEAAALERWIGAVGWETLLNRRGTTWRGLPEADKADVDAAKAKGLMLAHPALIKRPVVEAKGRVLVGMDALKQALGGGA